MYQQNNIYRQNAGYQQNTAYRRNYAYRPNTMRQTGAANQPKKSSGKGFWRFIAIVIVYILITRSHDTGADTKVSGENRISHESVQEQSRVSDEGKDFREETFTSPKVAGKDYSYAHGYYFQFLSAAEQNVYEEIIEALENYRTETDVTPLPATSWSNVRDALRYDHPEYYWLNHGIRYYSNNEAQIRRIAISVPEDARYTLPQLRSYAASVAANVAGMDTYEAYRTIYDTVAGMTTYGKADGVDDQTISGIMTDHLGVCAGYSDTFKFLCDAAGLPCITVIGYGFDNDGMNGGSHAWNMIMIDGSAYWVDVTWGDNCLEADYNWYGCPDYYTWFCVDDAAFLRRHSVSATMNQYSGNHFIATYPSCTDTRYTWFSLQDLVFSDYEEARSYIRSNLAGGVPYLWMQFTSQEEMDRTINNLVTYGLIGDFMQEAGVWYGEYQYSYDYCNMTFVLELR